MHVDRRMFLTGLGGLGAAALVRPPLAVESAGRVDIHHHMFGTDYPYRTAAEVLSGLEPQQFAANDLQAIERDNARKLLPQLKA